MIELPSKVTNAVQALSRLPSVGEKTALRMVMGMTHWKPSELAVFAEAVANLTHLKTCSECGMFSEENLCSICAHPHRRSSDVVCVVESVTDLLAIERSGQFKGLFIILGGVLNPLLGVGPEQLRMDELQKRVKDLGVTEIILALNPSVEGDATCAYIKNILPQHVRVERIGFGIPIGGHLEYLDSQTITKALENKKIF